MHDGDGERDSQGDLGEHGDSPRVEASIGLCTRDQNARRFISMPAFECWAVK
jgi:hypothetical protein